MLFAGWEVRWVKTVTDDLKMQHFQARGQSFSPYGPPSRQITRLFYFSCSKLILLPDYKWVCLRKSCL